MYSGRLDRARRTIGVRLMLWYSTTFVVSTALLFALAYLLLSSSIERKDAQDVREKVKEYAAQYQAGGTEALGREVGLEQRSGNVFFVRVAAPGGGTLYIDDPDVWAEFDLNAVARGDEAGEGEWRHARARDGKDVLDVASMRLADGTLVEVGKSSKDRRELLKRFRDVFAGFMVPIVLVGIVGGSLLASRVLRPLRDLVQTIRTISTGRMDARVPVRQSGDELDELGTLFNVALEKIETLIGGMRGSLDTVAHDLRTPMTRMRAAAEMALREAVSPEAYREALADCVEESDQILAMLNTLMDISEAETGAMQLQLEVVDLAALSRDAAELYVGVAEDKGIALEVHAPSELSVSGDRNRLLQVLANLLDNAVKYTPRGGRIDLDATRRGKTAVITVTDSGIGIASDEAPKIWGRLYRGDRSRSERGLGLGLSLVQAVVRAHNGRIELASAPGAGSRFVLTLPCAAERPSPESLPNLSSV